MPSSKAHTPQKFARLYWPSCPIWICMLQQLVKDGPHQARGRPTLTLANT